MLLWFLLFWNKRWHNEGIPGITQGAFFWGQDPNEERRHRIIVEEKGTISRIESDDGSMVGLAFCVISSCTKDWNTVLLRAIVSQSILCFAFYIWNDSNNGRTGVHNCLLVASYNLRHLFNCKNVTKLAMVWSSERCILTPLINWWGHPIWQEAWEQAGEQAYWWWRLGVPTSGYPDILDPNLVSCVICSC